MNRKTLTLSLIAGLLLVGLAPHPAAAQQWGGPKTALSAQTTATASADLATPGSTAILLHVYSASTSTRVVTFNQGINGTVYYPSVTITNPTSTGELWACPATPHSKFTIAESGSGTITAIVSWRTMAADPIGSECKKVDVSANTFGALSVTGLTNSGLTSGRVPYSGSGGLQADEAAFAYNAGTNTLTADHWAGVDLTASSLTSGRVPYASTAGLLTDASTFTFATGALSVGTSVATTRFLSTGTAPAVANVGADSCGTTAATIAGKDQAHVITVGATSGTECRVTFNVAFANAPVCVATGQTATDLHLVTTTTTVTVTGTLTAAEKLYVTCLGY